MSNDRDTGPPERYRHGDRIIPFQVVEKDKAGYKAKAGEIAMLNQSECSLDLMYHRGHLGNHDHDAKRRYDAGMWLRELHLKLHNVSVGVASYSDAWHKFQDIASDLSDVDCWNFKAFLETRRALKHHWRPLECVCIMDRRYGKAWPALHTSLDLLADLRGI